MSGLAVSAFVASPLFLGLNSAYAQSGEATLEEVVAGAAEKGVIEDAAADALEAGGAGQGHGQPGGIHHLVGAGREIEGHRADEAGEVQGVAGVDDGSSTADKVKMIFIKHGIPPVNKALVADLVSLVEKP